VPLETSGLPALAVLPRADGSLLRRLTGYGEADSAGEVDQLLRTGLARTGVSSALRILAPFLVGDGTGIEARMPYDIELR
jgi:hypothetical protein